MNTTALAKSLNDPEFKAKLQDLRRTDNVTNWYYIARAYLYLFVVAKDAAGKASKPSKAFKVNLKDMFPQR